MTDVTAAARRVTARSHFKQTVQIRHAPQVRACGVHIAGRCRVYSGEPHSSGGSVHKRRCRGWRFRVLFFGASALRQLELQLRSDLLFSSRHSTITKSSAVFAPSPRIFSLGDCAAAAGPHCRVCLVHAAVKNCFRLGAHRCRHQQVTRAQESLYLGANKLVFSILLICIANSIFLSSMLIVELVICRLVSAWAGF